MLRSDVLLHKTSTVEKTKHVDRTLISITLMKTKVGRWIFIIICFCLNKRSIIIFHNGNQAAVILLNKSSNESVRIWKKQTCCFWYKIILLITKFALGTSHFMLTDNITFGDKLDGLKTTNACPE